MTDNKKLIEEVPEPSAEGFEGILDRATLDEYLRADPDETYERLVVKANALASTVLRLLAASEPQGEPSDAQIIEKVRAYADDRYQYGRRDRTVGSMRIASDLYTILGVPLQERAEIQDDEEWEYRAVACELDSDDVYDSTRPAPSAGEAIDIAAAQRLLDSNADMPALVIGVQRRRKAGAWTTA